VEVGKGIRSLIPTGTLSEPEQPSEAVVAADLGLLDQNPFQPRQGWSEDELAELTESVRVHGILQPLAARRRGDRYELIAGSRRMEAARRLGLATVPVVVRQVTDREMLELALVENLQREDMNPADAAEAYQRLMREFSLTQEQVAERVGKSRSAVANAVRLLSLPPAVLDSLRKGEIDSGHAKALRAIEDPKTVVRAWRVVVRGGLSVRQTERLAGKLTGRDVPRGTPATGSAPSLDPNLQELQEQLTRRLSTRVRLHPSKTKGGSIEIEYSDDEDLDRLYWELLRQG
jgi:ParB family transcriptional regulator, chromosome partitioning protein